MKLPNHFKLIVESTNYMLCNLYEEGYLFDKRKGIKIFIGDSYGDPDLGLIDKNEQWALLLGNTSYLWIPGKIYNLNEAITHKEEIFQWPFAVRQINDFEVEVLDDPWSDNPGIYSFNVNTKAINRIRDFQQLEIPYDAMIKIDW